MKRLGVLGLRAPSLLGLALTLTLLPISGLAAQVTFREAVELALKHSAAATSVKRDDSCQDSTSRSVLHRTADSDLLSPFDLATVQNTLFLPEVTTWYSLINSAEVAQPSALPISDRRRRTLLCTVMAYAELAAVKSEMEILRRQQTLAKRFVNIEARRVFEKVDSPVVLTHAKLLAARTAMWSAASEVRLLQVHKRLANLTGLPEEQMMFAATSIPSLPNWIAADAVMQAAMRQVAAARDVAQVEHSMARTQRMKIRVDAAVGHANLADLMAASISEDQKFVALLETNFLFEKTKLQLLDETAKLEDWALDTAPRSDWFSLDSAPRATDALTTKVVSASESSSALNPTVRSIMITPAVSTLVTGQSQQFSAIAIYSNGSARNATLETSWQSFNDSDAIVSTSGLVTALAVGDVTVTATFGGVSQSQQVKIVVDDFTPFDAAGNLYGTAIQVVHRDMVSYSRSPRR